MKTTQLKGEGDHVGVTKEENYFPFPETEIASTQEELNRTAKVLFYSCKLSFT